MFKFKRSFEQQVRDDMIHLLKKVDSHDDLGIMATYISQVFNFFIMETLCSETSARQMISDQIFKKELGNFYPIMREEKFKPSQLIVAIAYLFRRISSLHFNQKDLIESPSFQLIMSVTVMEAEVQVLRAFPGIEEQWEHFMDFFMKNYLSPWDIRRQSDYRTRANFGTGIDYITIP